MKLHYLLLCVFCIISFKMCFAMEQRIPFYDPVCVLSFSSDGHSLLAGCSNGAVTIVDKVDTSIRKKVHVYDMPVSAVALDGSDLIIGYADGIVQLKSLYENPYATFKEQGGTITAAKITPLCIATGSSDGSLCIRSRVGSLLKNIRVSAGVSTMHVSGDACYIFVGCDDGAIWRYNTTCGDVEHLVQDLHKGKALCILTDSEGFYVAYENTEIIYFNFVDKTTKVFKAKYPLYALQLIPEKGVLVGYDGTNTESQVIVDIATRSVYTTPKRACEERCAVAINGSDVAVVQESRVCLTRITCETATWFIQCLTDGVPLKGIVIKDQEHNECGYVNDIQQSRYFRVNLFLRAPSLKTGAYIELIDMKGVHYNFYVNDKLMLIDRLIVFRNIEQNALSCVYRMFGHKRFREAYEVQHPCVSPFLMDIHTVLHSFNVPLVDAHLIVRAGTKYQKTIQGRQLNGKGLVWIFEDVRCMAPYILKLISRYETPKEEQHKAPMLHDTMSPAEQCAAESLVDEQAKVRVYEWPLLCLTRDSELYVQRLTGDRFRLSHYDETTGREMHYHEYQPSAEA